LASVLFVLHQALVFVPVAIVNPLLVEVGAFDREVGRQVAFWVWIGCEVALAVALARFVRRRLERGAYRGTPAEEELRKALAFDERTLERAVILAAAGSAAFAFLLGDRGGGIRIALALVESFALLFMSIFVIARMSITRVVKPLAVI